MDVWIERLLSDYPFLRTDTIRLFVAIAMQGPNVSVAHLMDNMGWSESRITKTLAEISCSSKKSTDPWFPSLIEETVDPSDLKGKLISLSPRGKTYSPECTPTPAVKDNAAIEDKKITLTITPLIQKDIDEYNEAEKAWKLLDLDSDDFETIDKAMERRKLAAAKLAHFLALNAS